MKPIGRRKPISSWLYLTAIMKLIKTLHQFRQISDRCCKIVSRIIILIHTLHCLDFIGVLRRTKCVKCVLKEEIPQCSGLFTLHGAGTGVVHGLGLAQYQTIGFGPCLGPV